MRTMLRFLHTADLHLDRPFQGLAGIPELILNRVRNSTFKALEHIVQSAIKEDVDFILISGDLYDGESRSLYAQSKLRELLNRLEPYAILVYVIHGNHDHLSGDWARLTWGNHIHFFEKNVQMKVFHKNNEPMVHIYGFSYPERQVLENMTPFYEKKEGAPYHIGMLHGFYQGGQDHDVYAPFTLQDLLDKDFDYWALGHIHKREQLYEEPGIWYPGTPQGLSIKETGDKGCSLVTMDKEQTKVEFIPTSDILWEECALKTTDDTTMESLLNDLMGLKESLRDDNRGTIARITIHGTGSIHHHLLDEAQLEDLMTTLRDGEEDSFNFVWLLDFKIKTTPPWDRVTLAKDNYFISDLIKLVDTKPELIDSLSPLYGHRRAKRFLDELTYLERQEILQEAEFLLIEALLGEGEIDA